MTASTTNKRKMDEKQELLPVTVLSGFLGSGKTTLLKHILQSNNHGLRIAIIVNDMAEVNIDGAHISRLSGKDDKSNLIQMQNGCICCTLRGDFLVELARMAWSNMFDYVLIESSGISEPQQVAETFTAALSMEMMDIPEETESDDRGIIEKVARAGGLEKVARLDTMVTVVDAFRFFSEFNTGEFLTDRFGRDEVPAEDERTISDLMADQIEFANVIIVNKIDMVDRATCERITSCIKALNPKAKIIQAAHSKVSPKEIVGTNMFDLAEAQMMSGWLASLHEMFLMDVNGKKTKAPKPETLEYGISSFVYRARKPFDPLKFYKLFAGKFVLLQPDEDENEEDENQEMAIDSEALNSDSEALAPSDLRIERKDSKGEDIIMHDEKEEQDPFLSSLPTETHEIVAAKASDKIWATMHRSKGWLWFATRPQQAGSWNTAGAMLRVEYEQDWYCELPEEEWASDEQVADAIRKDFVGEWGDRRQEIVFIGEKLDKDQITELLDDCLLSDKEFKKWEKVMKKNWSLEKKEEKLSELWDDSYWAEWIPGTMDHEHEHGDGDGYVHHKH